MQKTLDFIEKLENTFDEVDRQLLKEAYQKYYLSLDKQAQEKADRILDNYRNNRFSKIENTLEDARKLMQEIRKEKVKV